MKLQFSIIVILTMLSCSVMAQNSSEDKITIGAELQNLKKVEIDFPGNPIGIVSDPNDKYIAVEYIDSHEVDKKNPNHYLQVCSSDGFLRLWKTENFKKNYRRYMFVENGLLEIKANSVSLLGNLNGNLIWSVNRAFVGVVDDKLVACKMNGLTSSMMAFSLKDGTEIWKNSMALESGVFQNVPVDDNRGIVVTSNLYLVDWRTGEQIKLKSSTNFGSSGNVMIVPVLGGLFGGMIGGAVAGAMVGASYSSQYRNLIFPEIRNRQLYFLPSVTHGGLCSNVVEKDGCYYFADLKGLKCFDKQMNIKWKKTVDDESASCSRLVFKGDTLCLINLAKSVTPSGNFKYFGAPFMALFKASEGRLLTKKKFVSNSASIVSSVVDDKSIRVLFDNRVAEYSFSEDKIQSADRDTSEVGGLCGFLADDMCLVKTDDSGFLPVRVCDKWTPVITSKGMVVDVKDNKLKIIADSYATYIKVGEGDGMVFYQGGKGNKELWRLADGEASLVCSDVKCARFNYGKLEMITTTNRVRTISFD